MKTLSTLNQTRLAVLESTIKGTVGAFMRCGKALAEIRDTNLYRGSKFKTFEEYCEKRWGWKRAHVYRLIEAAQVTEEIKTLSPVIGERIENESQARAIAVVPASQRVSVLESAVKSGDVTASGIHAAAEAILSKPPSPTIDLDRTGHPIPAKALEYWKRREEPEDVLFHISKARAAVKDLQDSKDPMWVEVNSNSVYADLCNAYSNFKLAVPHAVCPVCQGQAPDTCTLCGGRGMISKFRYDTAVPLELKAVRDKHIKKIGSKVLGKKDNGQHAAI